MASLSPAPKGGQAVPCRRLAPRQFLTSLAEGLLDAAVGVVGPGWCPAGPPSNRAEHNGGVPFAAMGCPRHCGTSIGEAGQARIQPAQVYGGKLLKADGSAIELGGAGLELATIDLSGLILA